MPRYRADLVSSVFERWRIDDGLTGGPAITPKIRDQGDLFTVTTDYTMEASNTIVALVSEAGEPLTGEIEEGVSSAQPGDVLRSILIDRGPIASADLSTNRLAATYSNAPFLYTRRRPAVEVATEALRGIGGYLSLRRDGTLAADVLMPPVSPSPRSGPCLEIFSANTGTLDEPASVTWASATPLAPGDNFTLAGWVNVGRLGPSLAGLGGLNIVDMTGNAAPTGNGVEFYLDLQHVAPRLVLKLWGGAASEAIAPYPAALDPGWHFLAVSVLTAGFDQATFYAGRPGGTVDSLRVTGFGTIGLEPLSDGVRVGGGYVRPRFRGSIFEPSVWSSARSEAQLQSQMDDGLTGSEPTLAFYSPLDGDSAAARTDTVSTAVGAVEGDVVERPDLVVDLTVTPRPLRRRDLTPASLIEVRYDRNYEPLGPSDIAAVVPGYDASTGENQRLDLQQGYQYEQWPIGGVEDDYPDAEPVKLDSWWADRDGALATGQVMRYRYAPGREFAILGPTPDAPLRSGLLLEIGDEVQVIGYQDLADPGATYRAVQNRRILGQLDCELALWR